MAYDMTVVATAYQTARGMGASDKVMLALFEAAIVESGFRNLNYGDRDSVGFLQQRPSQGWGTVEQIMNVGHATRSFVSRAIPNEHKYSTAGLLAQSVQRSAFPLKYDAAAGPARLLLTQMQRENPGSVPVATGGPSFASLAKALDTLTDPRMWMRVGMALVAGVLFIIAVFQLTGDGQLSTASKKAVDLGKLVLTKKVVK